MYSFPDLEPGCCSMSGFNCCLLSCIQVSQVAGKVVWYSYLSKNFPQFVVIHTIKGFSIVSEAEVDGFLEFSCFFYDPMDVGNLISGSSAFFKSSLYIWKFSVHILLKPSLEDFEHYLVSMWNECNCEVVWTFFGLALLLDWNGNWPFPILWPLLSFPNCWHIECSTLTAPSFKIWNSFITILLTIFLMLYISSPWLIYLIIEFVSLSPLYLSLLVFSSQAVTLCFLYLSMFSFCFVFFIFHI